MNNITLIEYKANQIISSPMNQFDINYFDALGITIKFATNFGLYMIIALLLLLVWNILSDNNMSIITSKWGLSLEALYATIHNLAISQIGVKGGKYFVFLYTIFTFILVCNYLSVVPYSYALTAQFCLALYMSVTIIIGTTILGLYKHNVKFFGLFCPEGTPLGLVPLLVIIEFISYLARAVSLGLRLSGNLIAGHLLEAILSGFIGKILVSSILFFIIGLIPFAIFLGIAALEFCIMAIQAYVFTILTSSYISDAENLH